MATALASKPQRILMTADAAGGVWTYAIELARSLEPFGVEILIATMGAPLSIAQRREAEQLPHVAVAESKYQLEWMDDPWEEVDLASAWLLKLARRFKADLVHLNGYVHAALPWGVPVLVVGHSCVLSWWHAVLEEPTPARYREYQRRVSVGLRAADFVVAPTSAMLAMLEEHYGFTTPARVIANGRCATEFRVSEKRPEIFSAGRLWDQAKNIAILDHVAPLLEWPVVVAGHTQRPDGEVADFQHVRMLGQVAAKRVATELASASIYAAPARYEPFGLGILEAALSGCALVLADIPSLRETWSGAAVFVAPDDAHAWAKALNGLSQNPAMREAYGRRALLHARTLTPEKMAQAYYAVYRYLLAGVATSARETALVA
jgi:glycosyltransferase involved in cell wall biosynthesis